MDWAERKYVESLAREDLTELINGLYDDQIIELDSTIPKWTGIDVLNIPVSEGYGQIDDGDKFTIAFDYFTPPSVKNKFAAWCAEQIVNMLPNPEPILTEATRTVYGWMDGNVTNDQLSEAYDNAKAIADGASAHIAAYKLADDARQNIHIAYRDLGALLDRNPTTWRTYHRINNEIDKIKANIKIVMEPTPDCSLEAAKITECAAGAVKNVIHSLMVEQNDDTWEYLQRYNNMASTLDTSINPDAKLASRLKELLSEYFSERAV